MGDRPTLGPIGDLALVKHSNVFTFRKALKVYNKRGKQNAGMPLTFNNIEYPNGYFINSLSLTDSELREFQKLWARDLQKVLREWATDARPTVSLPSFMEVHTGSFPLFLDIDLKLPCEVAPSVFNEVCGTLMTEMTTVVHEYYMKGQSESDWDRVLHQRNRVRFRSVLCDKSGGGQPVSVSALEWTRLPDAASGADGDDREMRNWNMYRERMQQSAMQWEADAAVDSAAVALTNTQKLLQVLLEDAQGNDVVFDQDFVSSLLQDPAKQARVLEYMDCGRTEPRLFEDLMSFLSSLKVRSDRLIVCGTPSVVWIPTQRKWKYGLHVHWPNTIVGNATARQIRYSIVCKLQAINVRFGNHPIDWDDAVDRSVYQDSERSGGLRLIGAPKVQMCPNTHPHDDCHCVEDRMRVCDTSFYKIRSIHQPWQRSDGIVWRRQVRRVVDHFPERVAPQQDPWPTYETRSRPWCLSHSGTRGAREAEAVRALAEAFETRRTTKVLGDDTFVLVPHEEVREHLGVLLRAAGWTGDEDLCTHHYLELDEAVPSASDDATPVDPARPKAPRRASGVSPGTGVSPRTGGAATRSVWYFAENTAVVAELLRTSPNVSQDPTDTVSLRTLPRPTENDRILYDHASERLLTLSTESPLFAVHLTSVRTKASNVNPTVNYERPRHYPEAPLHSAASSSANAMRLTSAQEHAIRSQFTTTHNEGKICKQYVQSVFKKVDVTYDRMRPDLIKKMRIYLSGTNSQLCLWNQPGSEPRPSTAQHHHRRNVWLELCAGGPDKKQIFGYPRCADPKCNAKRLNFDQQRIKCVFDDTVLAAVQLKFADS